MIMSPHFKPISRVESPIKQQNIPAAAQSQNSASYLEKAGNLRWIILALSCFIMFGNFYAYDNPSALNRQLKQWMADRSDAEFEYHLNLLYTVYSAPNIVCHLLWKGPWISMEADLSWWVVLVDVFGTDDFCIWSDGKIVDVDDDWSIDFRTGRNPWQWHKAVSLLNGFWKGARGRHWTQFEHSPNRDSLQ